MIGVNLHKLTLFVYSFSDSIKNLNTSKTGNFRDLNVMSNLVVLKIGLEIQLAFFNTLCCFADILESIN